MGEQTPPAWEFPVSGVELRVPLVGGVWVTAEDKSQACHSGGKGGPSLMWQRRQIIHPNSTQVRIPLRKPASLCPICSLCALAGRMHSPNTRCPSDLHSGAGFFSEVYFFVVFSLLKTNLGFIRWK